MKGAFITCLLAAAFCLAACGPKETPAEKDPDAGKKVSADKADNAASVAGKMVVVELTAEQREDLERQRRENRSRGATDVTVTFTPEQLEAIHRVCPECKETSITWHTDRVGVRVKLYFDGAGRIRKPLDPVPYVSR